MNGFNVREREKEQLCDKRERERTYGTGGIKKFLRIFPSFFLPHFLALKQRNKET